MRTFTNPAPAFASVAVSALLWSVTATGQSSDLPAEVVVTSSRIDTPLRQIGTSVGIMTQSDIEARGNQSLTDVLRQMTAVGSSRAGGVGQPTSLRIRGEEGFRTLVLFDGIRLSDPSTPQIGPQFEQILSSGIGRVEILRGPQGLSYGADAGGVVAVSSLATQEPLSGGLDLQHGAFGTRQLAGHLGGVAGNTDYFLTVADFHTDGFNSRVSDTARDNDGYGNTTAHARVGIAVTDALRVDLVHRAVTATTQYDGCGFPRVDDCFADYELGATRLAAAYQTDDFSHSLAYSTTRSDRGDYTAGRFAFGADGDLNRWEYLGSARGLPGVDLVWGGDWEEAASGTVSRNNTGVFLEMLSDFSSAFFMTVGLRHDDNDDFGTHTSQRMSVAYLIDTGTAATLKLRGAYGTGFRAPSPYEVEYNRGPFAYPPASQVTLREETSRGWEVGVEYFTNGGMHLEAVYFDQRVADAIDFDLETFSGYLQTLGTGTSTGLEMSARMDLTDALSLTGNVTRNDTTQPDGRQRRRRPNTLANLGLSYLGLDGRLRLNGFTRMSRDATDGLAALDDFAVLDLSFSFKLSASVQVYARLENALDERYQELPDYNTAERAGYIGLRLQF